MTMVVASSENLRQYSPFYYCAADPGFGHDVSATVVWQLRNSWLDLRFWARYRVISMANPLKMSLFDPERGAIPIMDFAPAAGLAQVREPLVLVCGECSLGRCLEDGR
jgi:hypothetical protein